MGMSEGGMAEWLFDGAAKTVVYDGWKNIKEETGLSTIANKPF